MTKFLTSTVMTLTLMIAAPTLADTYNFDASHTAVTWHINHFGFSNPSGKFMSAKGALALDEKTPDNSKVELDIDVTAINTGVAKLDEHLKTKDFFDVAQFPTAHFVSTKVEQTGADTATVTGDLTLHGVTKPITLAVHLNKIGQNMMGKKTAGFTASGKLKRSDFGMTTYIPNLGDEVTIDIEAEANAG
ncbi:MAG: YceI family protein [Alphaproteobacteria bacterium]|nr:YceI family protein [Alphaproteobacteria bacterium]MBV8548965.1 YceI family protein [Alphaproteobacteria bacterium]